MVQRCDKMARSPPSWRGMSGDRDVVCPLVAPGKASAMNLIMILWAGILEDVAAVNLNHSHIGNL